MTQNRQNSFCITVLLKLPLTDIPRCIADIEKAYAHSQALITDGYLRESFPIEWLLVHRCCFLMVESTRFYAHTRPLVLLFAVVPLAMAIWMVASWLHHTPWALRLMRVFAVSAQWVAQMGIAFLESPPLKAFMLLHSVVHTKSNGSRCVRNETREPEWEVQIMKWVWLSDCRFQKSFWTQLPNSDARMVWGREFQALLDDKTSTLFAAYWQIYTFSNISTAQTKEKSVEGIKGCCQYIFGTTKQKSY